MKKIIKLCRLIPVLCLFSALIGCSETSALGVDRSAQPTAAFNKSNNSQDVAFQFVTSCGEYITVVQDTVNDVSYRIPTSPLDSRLRSTPIQICKGNYVIDIGFASADLNSHVDDNIYGVIYKSIIDEYLEENSDKFNERFRSLLKDYDNVYKNHIYRDDLTFTDGNLQSTKWSDAVVDLSLYTKMTEYKLPVVTCTHKLTSGEYLVARCYATLDSGLWYLNDLPAYLDVALSDDYIDKTNSDYAEYITSMQEAYDNCLQLLQTELPYICIGDYSDKYTVIPMNNLTTDVNTYGVDTSMFDTYAFITLSDGSVYLVYEKNNVRAVECVMGDSNHNLSTDWDKYDTSVVDKDTGEVYNFTWTTN